MSVQRILKTGVTALATLSIVAGSIAFAVPGGGKGEKPRNAEFEKIARTAEAEYAKSKNIKEAIATAIAAHGGAKFGDREALMDLAAELNRKLAEKDPKRLANIEANGKPIKAAELEDAIRSLDTDPSYVSKHGKPAVESAQKALREILELSYGLDGYSYIKDGKPMILPEALASFFRNADGSLNLPAIEGFRDVMQIVNRQVSLFENKAARDGVTNALAKLNLQEIFRAALIEKFPKADKALIDEIVKKCT